MINASLALGLALAFALLWVFFGWWIGRRVQSHNEFALDR